MDQGLVGIMHDATDGPGDKLCRMDCPGDGAIDGLGGPLGGPIIVRQAKYFYSALRGSR